VRGEIDSRTGFVMDLGDLKETMQREVLDSLDHRFLNKEVPEFAAQIPTTENIAVAIWRRLEGSLGRTRLHRVRLYEAADLFVDYFGE